jgi:hypothetical protein
MSLFCFLWTPLFYLFWRSLNEESPKSGETLALMLGSLAALIQFFLGSFISPGGFGFSRWFSACIDIIGLPAALPFILWFGFAFLRIISQDADFTNLAFLWLIPVAALRALNWSTQNDPILLLGVPLLWTAVVVGTGFFVRIIQNGWGIIIIPAAGGAIVLPLTAATSYWAFFSQHNITGFVLLGLTLVPAGISIASAVIDSRK